MNIEITHDVDHLGMKDHLRDLALPRFLAYQAIKLARGLISFDEFATSVREVVSSVIHPVYDSWQNFDEWIALHRRAGVSGTWFFACRPGLGISYVASRARPFVTRLREEGHQIGLHSQCREDLGGLRTELDEFCEAYDAVLPLPVRMHYLAKSPDHVERMQAYRDIVTYDSSIYDASQTTARTEFIRPINIMDGHQQLTDKRFFDVQLAKVETLALSQLASETGHWVMLDLHQRVLSPCFARHRAYMIDLFERVLTG